MKWFPRMCEHNIPRLIPVLCRPDISLNYWDFADPFAMCKRFWIILLELRGFWNEPFDLCGDDCILEQYKQCKSKVVSSLLETASATKTLQFRLINHRGKQRWFPPNSNSVLSNYRSFQAKIYKRLIYFSVSAGKKYPFLVLKFRTVQRKLQRKHTNGNWEM